MPQRYVEAYKTICSSQMKPFIVVAKLFDYFSFELLDLDAKDSLQGVCNGNLWIFSNFSLKLRHLASFTDSNP